MMMQLVLVGEVMGTVAMTLLMVEMVWLMVAAAVVVGTTATEPHEARCLGFPD